MKPAKWLYTAAALGIALALAPVAFSMFSRAPMGGQMIDEFRPYMTNAEIDRFAGYMEEIGAAKGAVDALPATTPGRDAAPLTAWREQWPAIDADMSSMLRTMKANVSRFDGIAALPPFPLFPWFFVIPGVMLAVVASATARSAPDSRARRRGVVAIGILGIGLMAAPAVFQMFTRAPGGARMIDDFRPLMTASKVTDVQGYFIVIGSAEATMRTTGVAATSREVSSFTSDWPEISKRMAPMIGAMADNVDNYAAVDALPPFSLFPWFFVAPGVLAIALAAAARPRRRADLDARPTHVAEGALFS